MKLTNCPGRTTTWEVETTLSEANDVTPHARRTLIKARETGKAQHFVKEIPERAEAHTFPVARLKGTHSAS